MISPLVSILMTAYNREKYIAEAIQSVLASTHSNFELIIVDDVSTDNTVKIARGFAEKDNRIKIYINNVNLGDYPNRNKAASYANGKYLKYLDSDDIIYPWGLEVMVYCMEQRPDAGYGLISNGLKTDKILPLLFTPEQAYFTFYFRGSMVLTGPTGAIINRSVFEKLNGFSGKPYIGDSELWLKLSQEHSMVAMPLDLIWWRQHEEQQFKEGNNNRYYEHNSYLLFVNALLSTNCPFSGKYKKIALRNLKNRYSRNLIILCIKGKVSKALNLYKLFNLNKIDIVKSISFNTYPTEL